MIGGQGEKKTFRLAAQYAQELNTTALFADLPRKLDALQGHLDDLGRARERHHRHAARHARPGADPRRGARPSCARCSPPAAATSTRCSPTRRWPARCSAGFVWGDPDEVAAQVQELIAVGLDGFVVNLIADADDTDAVALAGETLTKAIG